MKITQLVNHTIGIGRGKEQESPGSDVIVDTWQLVLADQQTGDQIIIGFREAVRDTLVQQLTSGIVIANGDISKIIGAGP